MPVHILITTLVAVWKSKLIFVKSGKLADNLDNLEIQMRVNNLQSSNLSLIFPLSCFSWVIAPDNVLSVTAIV